jgi:hypothetical protein
MVHCMQHLVPEARRKTVSSDTEDFLVIINQLQLPDAKQMTCLYQCQLNRSVIS